MKLRTHGLFALLVKERTGAMEQTCVRYVCRSVNARAIEACEDRSRGHAVKTMAVIEYAKVHENRDDFNRL